MDVMLFCPSVTPKVTVYQELIQLLVQDIYGQKLKQLHLGRQQQLRNCLQGWAGQVQRGF